MTDSKGQKDRLMILIRMILKLMILKDIQRHVHKGHIISKSQLLKRYKSTALKENDVDPEAFFDFYESKGWKIGRNPMKDWKAAVRNWERNDYGQHKKKKKKKSQYDEIEF